MKEGQRRIEDFELGKKKLQGACMVSQAKHFFQVFW